LKNNKSSGQIEREPKTAAKRPYVVPAFRFDKVFEVTALACGKVHSTEHKCRVSRRAS